VTAPLRVEATGDTVAGAKWNALRQLELPTPTLDRSTVEFEVLSEGLRGPLGVGYEPARVIATAAGSPAAFVGARRNDQLDGASRLRSPVERVASELGVHCEVEISESEEILTATCVGNDLGRLVGGDGQTLDDLQTIAAAVQRRSENSRDVVVDAAGCRSRRREQLEAVALRSASEARQTRQRVELEPMGAAERKLVHAYLDGHAGVLTTSEGVEPYRRVVVEPA
jgi:spoIIIJ-associated protein